MLIVIGLDLNLTSTGAIRLVKGELLETNRAVIGSKFTGVQRLIDIEDKIKIFIDRLPSQLICIEDYAFSRNTAAFSMGELGGVIRRMLHKRQEKWILVGPGQLKKFAAGKGNAPKDLIIMNVYKKWGVEFDNSDEADAFVLAKIGQALLEEWDLSREDWDGTGRKVLTQYQLEVITELRKKYKEVLASCQK